MAEHLEPAAKKALAVLFVVAVPLLFIAVSVTWAINDLSLYEYGFDRYRVTSVTGIEKADLMTVAREIRSYFNSSTEPLAVTTRVFGEERTLFNQKEVVHMHDVKKLVRGVYWVGVGSAVFIVGFIAVGFYLHRREFLRTLARLGLLGAGVTVGLTLLVGLMSLVSFDFLFTLFHELSFANDFWQLDPRRDFLVMMFPSGFWFDAAMLVVGLVVLQAAIVAGSVGGVALYNRWQSRKRGATPSPSASS